MNKSRQVARYEYLHHVGSKRFWLLLISIPLGFLFIFGLSMLISRFSFDTRPVGIVDQGSLIQLEPDNSKKSTFFNPQIHLYLYPVASSARAEAEKKEIQGFVMLPEDYVSNYQLN